MNPVGLVIPSLYNNIDLKLKVQDYKTRKKTHLNIKYKWEKMAEASISSSSDYQLLWYTYHGNWVSWLLCAALFLFRKWCCVQCSDKFKRFVNGKVTKHFKYIPFSCFMAQWHFPFGLIFYSLAMALPKVASYKLYLVDFFNCWARFLGLGLLSKKLCSLEMMI